MVQRLVKCRLRSEIEVRKAAESTMKRAVQEARELKKELILLRQEKEELHLAARKESSRYGQKRSPATSRDDQAAKQGGSNKAVELKLRQQIQTLTARHVELESRTHELQQQVTDIEAEKTAAIAQSSAELKENEQVIAAMRDELKKTKLAIDETKRKCQKMLKEKREEAQKSLQENEQLALCAKTLERQLALLPQLKKQLERAKEKRADVADVWQKKLEQREQAFLREENANKQRLAESATQITELMEEKQDLQTKLEELKCKLCGIDNDHQDELRHENQRLSKMEKTTKQLQEKVLAAETAAREAEQAEVVARETQEQETRLRQLAEEAADAVEVRAEKAERDLAEVQMQLDRLERALEARGVTLDYLLKQQAPISTAGRTLPTSSKARTNSTKPVSTTTRDPARSRATIKARTTDGDAKVSGRTKVGRSNNNEEE